MGSKGTRTLRSSIPASSIPSPSPSSSSYSLRRQKANVNYKETNIDAVTEDSFVVRTSTPKSTTKKLQQQNTKEEEEDDDDMDSSSTKSSDSSIQNQNQNQTRNTPRNTRKNNTNNILKAQNVLPEMNVEDEELNNFDIDGISDNFSNVALTTPKNPIRSTRKSTRLNSSPKTTPKSMLKSSLKTPKSTSTASKIDKKRISFKPQNRKELSTPNKNTQQKPEQKQQSTQAERNSPSSTPLRNCSVILEAIIVNHTPKSKNEYSQSPLTSPISSLSQGLKDMKVVRSLNSSLNSSLAEEETSPTENIRRTRSCAPKFSESYFNKKDNDDEKDADFENDIDVDTDEEDDNDMLTDEDDESQQTNKSHSSSFLQSRSFCLTPKSRKIINKSFADYSPRLTPNVHNVTDTPSSENFFTADKRVKFRSVEMAAKAEKIRKVNEAKKPIKRPRKGNRQGIDKIQRNAPPTLPNFSVTKDATKIPTDAQCNFPWYEKNDEKIEMLTDEIAKDFPRWFTYLSEGFNIMLHGYGSKETIFDSFSTFLGNKYLSVSINGLFKNFNARKFLGNFVNTIDYTIETRSHGSNMTFITEDVAQKLSEIQHHPVFILVSNFDVLASRHPNMLTCLCGLAKVPYVHIVASSDHVNSGLGISPLQSLQLKFAWFDCTTFMPYQNELMWNPSTFGETSDASTAKTALEHMLKSITSNAKKAFGLLAKLQLEKLEVRKKSKGFAGVEFRELSRVCREAFIAHSDIALRALLTEFIDHKLIHFSGKSKHDDNLLVIDLDVETLQKYAQS